MTLRDSFRLFVLAASMSGAALMPKAVQAADCGGTFVYLVPDGRFRGPVSITTAADAQFIFFPAPGHRYSVEVEHDQFNTVVVAVGEHGVGCPSTNIAGLRHTSLMAPSSPSPDFYRASFVATSDESISVRVAAEVRPGTVRVSVSDTTMYSPAWTTNATYNTYYSIFNTADFTISATLTLSTTDGTPAGTTTLAVPPGRTLATNTGALGTPRNVTGTATLTHNGPPAALLVEAAIANFAVSPPYIQPVKFSAVREGR